MAKVTHKYNRSRMHAILASPYGGLAKDMIKRGHRVVAAAKTNLLAGPRRYDSGDLYRSIHMRLIKFHGYPAIWVGSDLEYARYVHDGTGIYGPKGVPIRPKKASHLVFTPKGQLRVVFAKEVKGMPPNPFLQDALKAVRY